MGTTLPSHHSNLEKQLGTSDPIHGVPTRGPSRHLHNERDRSAQPPDPQSDQNTRAFPQRRCRKKTNLPINNQRSTEMGENPSMDQSHARIQNTLRRTTT